MYNDAPLRRVCMQMRCTTTAEVPLQSAASRRTRGTLRADG